MKTALKLLWMVFWMIVYLGLAVLGRGGFAAFFAQPALAVLAGVTVALAVVAYFAGGSRWVLPVFLVVGLLAAYLPAFADREGSWAIDGDVVRWGGVALFAARGAMRLWPVFVLGDRFSGLVAIQSGHTLVTGN